MIKYNEFHNPVKGEIIRIFSFFLDKSVRSAVMKKIESENKVMKMSVLEHSPIVYAVDDSARERDWVVFLHAAFVDHNLFARQSDFFSGKYNLIVPDLLGHGGSTRAKKGDKIERTAEWLAKILDKHGVRSAHFVGISLGSVFAQDFANRFPDRVRSLACFGGYDVNDFDRNLQKANAGQQMRMMFQALFSVKRFAEANKKISAFTPQGQEEFYRMNLGFKKSSFRFLSGLGRLVNVFPKTERNYPLLIGCGEHDLPAELDVVRAWAKKEPCSLWIAQGAGHCVNLDRPEAFHRVLAEFWETGTLNAKNE